MAQIHKYPVRFFRKKNHLLALYGLSISMTVLFPFSQSSCLSSDIMETRKLKINRIDLMKIKDGLYPGSYTYGNYTYRIETKVMKHAIADIRIVDNRDTRYAKKAEGVIQRIVEKQNPDVDAVTGATTTSKALMKAVENSLKQGIVNP